jgi:hypothetical protein
MAEAHEGTVKIAWFVAEREGSFVTFTCAVDMDTRVGDLRELADRTLLEQSDAQLQEAEVDPLLPDLRTAAASDALFFSMCFLEKAVEEQVNADPKMQYLWRQGQPQIDLDMSLSDLCDHARGEGWALETHNLNFICSFDPPRSSP